MSPVALPEPAAAETPRSRECGDRFMLWIDGVGAFLVCLGEQVTFGGPAAEGKCSDVSLLANLSRKHVTFARSGEKYVLHAHAPSVVAGRNVHDRTDLSDGNEIQLGSNVRLRFRVPTVMSGSARLEFVSDHRPAQSCDAIILMDETCLLGPSLEQHVRCPGWSEAVLLFRRAGEMWCKSRGELFINNQHVPGGGPLVNGAVVTGHEMRFRMEAV